MKTKNDTNNEATEAVTVEAEIVKPEETPKVMPHGILARMVAAQQEICTVTKDATNPHFKSTYATLKAVWEAIRDAVAKYGILVYSTIEDGILTTHAADADTGDELTCKFPISGGTPQQLGSAITYARRYTISALFNVVCDDDDDGNAASGVMAKQQLKPYTPPTAPAANAAKAPAKAELPF